MHVTREMYGEVPLRRSVPLSDRRAASESMPWDGLSLEDVSLIAAVAAMVIFLAVFVLFVFI